MKLQTCQYKVESGWDDEPDAALDSENTLVIVFGTSEFNKVSDAIRQLRQQFPRSTLVGCSSSGEIYQSFVYDDSLSVAIMQLEQTPISVVSCSFDEASDSRDAGISLARQLDKNDLRSILVLSDGLTVNGSQLIDGLQQAVPESVIITGGLAGDADRFQKTWILRDGELSSGNMIAVAFYGDNIGIGHGSRGGWDMLGPQREVTRSVDNVLYELDGQPALQLYKKYLGELADGLPATGLRFPLAIINPDPGVEDTVRTILAVDEAEQSITFAGDIPEGAYVRLMRANFERLIDGATDAALAVDSSAYRGGPLLAISISCVGRRLVLGPRAEEEIDAALGELPAGTRQIGFYSYGEISPLASGRCDLHNQTMTITLLWENT